MRSMVQFLNDGDVDLDVSNGTIDLAYRNPIGQIEWPASEEEDDDCVISMDLPEGYQPKS